MRLLAKENLIRIQTDHFKTRLKQPSDSICLAVICEGDDVCDWAVCDLWVHPVPGAGRHMAPAAWTCVCEGEQVCVQLQEGWSHAR